MKALRNLACLALGISGLLSITQAQIVSKKAASDQSQVEVNQDRFSGTKVVTLRPQRVLDTANHQLEMSLEAKVKGSQESSGLDAGSESVQMKFTSLSNSSIDFGDQELHFIVDGKPLKAGKTSGSIGPSLPGAQASSQFKLRKRMFAVVDPSILRQITRGKNVEMRLGPIEVPLDAKVINQIGIFVSSISTK